MFDINTHLISEITYQQIDKKNIIFVSNFFSYKKKISTLISIQSL